MDIQIIRNLVNGAVSGDTFALSTSTLESNAINELSSKYFPGDKIQLTIDPSNYKEEIDNGIIVKGTGCHYPFKDMNVELTLTISPAMETNLTLSAAGLPGWKMVTSFPLFKRTLAEHIIFTHDQESKPTLALYSHDSESEKQGSLHFDGKVDLSSMTGGLSELLKIDYPQQISGTITMQDNGSKVTAVDLPGNTIENVGIGGLSHTFSIGFKIGAKLYHFANAHSAGIPYIELTTQFPFKADHSLSLSVKITNLESDIRFSAKIDDLIDAALDELKVLLNNEGLADLIPDEFHLEDVIKFSSFFFDYNLNSKKITLMGIGVESTRSWNLYHLEHSNKDLVARDLKLDFRLYEPFGDKRLWVSIGGDISITGGGTLSITGSSSRTWDIEGYLKDDTPLMISDAIKEFLDSRAEVPDIGMHKFDFNISSGNYALDILLQGYWPIKNDNDITLFAIARVGMGVQYVKGAGTSARFVGLINAADTDIEIEASHDPEQGGWQFTGSTGAGQQIHIGTLIDDIAAKFGVDSNLPTAISGLTIENLHVAFNTKSKDFSFKGEAIFPVEGSGDVDVVITVDLKHTDGNFTKHFAGHITFGGLQFDLVFDKDNTSTTFIAAYHQDGGSAVNVKTLVEAISPTAAGNVPDSLQITLIDALMAYNQTTVGTATDKKFLFELDMSGGVDLTQLPLVGKFFTADQALKLTLQALATSKDFTQDNVEKINGLIPEGVTQLPDAAVTSRLKLLGNMNIGGVTRELALPLEINDSPTPTQPLKAQTNPSDSVKWIKLQKNFGPLHIERVGVSYKDSNLWFLLDAALSAGGLNLSLEGLSVHSPLNSFHPVFGLNGLGIDYSNGAVEIGGAFLGTEVTGTDGEKYTEYDGTAIVKAKAITLSAIGSYAEIKGHKSLFIYAVLNMPLGGPAFFFVEGLAGGFGYNRSFILPPIDQIAPFPLVQEAMGKAPGAATTANLADELAKIRDYIPPDIGEYFIAVGLKYNSFKLVDSFALLSVSFGKHFEIDILGLSRIVVPPMVTKSPLAVVEMALSARFAPDEGILSIKAQLTNASYLLSPNCHLTGGFAFCTWFHPNEHDGDFIITLGGYHPHFKVPAHYPKVPRLGFNWQVTDKLSIKGDAYFALCSHALMAGGHLEALYHDGALKAWFKAGADFLVAWKPYHYEASMYIDLGASYTFHFFGTHHITIDVGADLELWGPKFAGKAKIHIWIITVTVHFGDSSSTPRPIDWDTFKSSFLPANDKVCSIAARDGLTRTMKSTESTDGNERWLVNPKHFTLTANTAIPIKDAYKKDTQNQVTIDGTPVPFGIGSMAINLGAVDSDFTFTIDKIASDGTRTPVEDEFTYTPIKKKVPAGLWGKELKPDINGTKFIDNTVCGFEISPKDAPAAGETGDVERKDLSFSTGSVPGAYKCRSIASQAVETAMDDAARRTKIRDTIVPAVDSTTGKSTRGTLLEALDMETGGVRVSAANADYFLIPPRILKAA